jgi:hypothetical protein
MPKIRSIETIDQYIIENTSGKTILFTVVGEIHDQTTDCRSSQENISKTAEDRLQTKNMLLMLEFAPSLDRSLIARLGSTIFKDVYTTDLCPIAREKAFGIDIRTIIIGRQNQSALFNQDSFDYLKTMLRTNRGLYFDTFLKSIWESELLKKISSSNCKENIIIQNCYNKLLEFYGRVYTLLQTCTTQNECVEMFTQTRYLWGCVMDLNVLYYTLCKNYEYDEYFVVLGLKHSENISEILNRTVPPGNRQHLSGCVDTGDLW